MARSLTSILAVLIWVSLTLEARASTICERFNVQGQDRQYSNCRALFRNRLVPNAPALNYTLQYWLENRDELKDPSCALEGMSRATGCASCREESWTRAGFQNQCSFVINDLQRPWRERRPAARRTTAYYVDLCSSDPNKIVRTFYMNGGIGTPFDSSRDRGTQESEFNKSTLAGAFKLEGRVFHQRDAYNLAAYQGILRRSGGTIPAVYMAGLNSSNNQSEADKPIHVSPFRSSWGCPSVSEETGNWLFNEMTSRGSTLYMAYAGPRFEQRGDSCINDDSRAGSQMPGNPAVRERTRR